MSAGDDGQQRLNARSFGLRFGAEGRLDQAHATAGMSEACEEGHQRLEAQRQGRAGRLRQSGGVRGRGSDPPAKALICNDPLMISLPADGRQNGRGSGEGGAALLPQGP